MKLVDVNLLLYAVNTRSERHRDARKWLEATLTNESVALPWIVILGFLRLVTSRSVLTDPMPAASALDLIDEWLARPNVVALSPGRDHWRILETLVAISGTAGNLTTDAHLAALALEHGCQLCSTDADFGRFPQLDWVNPIAPAVGERPAAYRATRRR